MESKHEHWTKKCLSLSISLHLCLLWKVWVMGLGIVTNHNFWNSSAASWRQSTRFSRFNQDAFSCNCDGVSLFFHSDNWFDCDTLWFYARKTQKWEMGAKRLLVSQELQQQLTNIDPQIPWKNAIIGLLFWMKHGRKNDPNRPRGVRPRLHRPAARTWCKRPKTLRSWAYGKSYVHDMQLAAQFSEFWKRNLLFEKQPLEVEKLTFVFGFHVASLDFFEDKHTHTHINPFAQTS